MSTTATSDQKEDSIMDLIEHGNESMNFDDLCGLDEADAAATAPVAAATAAETTTTSSGSPKTSKRVAFVEQLPPVAAAAEKNSSFLQMRGMNASMPDFGFRHNNDDDTEGSMSGDDFAAAFGGPSTKKKISPSAATAAGGKGIKMSDVAARLNQSMSCFEMVSPERRMQQQQQRRFVLLNQTDFTKGSDDGKELEEHMRLARLRALKARGGFLPKSSSASKVALPPLTGFNKKEKLSHKEPHPSAIKNILAAGAKNDIDEEDEEEEEENDSKPAAVAVSSSTAAADTEAPATTTEAEKKETRSREGGGNGEEQNVAAKPAPTAAASQPEISAAFGNKSMPHIQHLHNNNSDDHNNSAAGAKFHNSFSRVPRVTMRGTANNNGNYSSSNSCSKLFLKLGPNAIDKSSGHLRPTPIQPPPNAKMTRKKQHPKEEEVDDELDGGHDSFGGDNDDNMIHNANESNNNDDQHKGMASPAPTPTLAEA